MLVPAYHHGAEVEALVQAGVDPRFYDVYGGLEPRLEDLEALRSERTRALYLIHYLGFPQASGRWRAWCDEHGLLLIEDAAQAWLAETPDGPVGAEADLAVFCLYKTFGLPDGAALFSRQPPGSPSRRRRPLGVSSQLRRHVAWLEGRSAAMSRLLDPAHSNQVATLAEEIALGDPDTKAASASLRLLARVTDPMAAARRRENTERLLAALGSDLEPLFSEIPAGASPFAFAVATENKRDLLAWLSRRGVRALDFWSAAHPRVPPGSFPRSDALRSRVVALPVHQELRPEDVARIGAALKGFSARPRTALERVADLETYRDEWDALAATTGNVFSTWEWAAIWWKHFGAGRTARIVWQSRTKPTDSRSNAGSRPAW